MVATVVNIHAARTQLSQLFARAEKGGPITIARAGKPVAQLVPVPTRKRRKLPLNDALLQVEEYAFDGPAAN